MSCSTCINAMLRECTCVQALESLKCLQLQSHKTWPVNIKIHTHLDVLTLPAHIRMHDTHLDTPHKTRVCPYTQCSRASVHAYIHHCILTELDLCLLAGDALASSASSFSACSAILRPPTHDTPVLFAPEPDELPSGCVVYVNHNLCAAICFENMPYVCAWCSHRVRS